MIYYIITVSPFNPFPLLPRFPLRPGLPLRPSTPGLPGLPAEPGWPIRPGSPEIENYFAFITADRVSETY